jgi:CRP-like cAMP-binding protein
VIRTLADLRTEVDQAFGRQEYDLALRRCVVLLQGAPGGFDARMRVGDILLERDLPELAGEVYKLTAWHFTKAGFPLLGITALKMLSVVEQGYADALEVLAGLYAAGSDRVSAGASRPRLPALEEIELSAAGEHVDAAVPLAGMELCRLAAQLARDDRGLLAYPEKLPPIPLFSDLGEDDFAAVLADLRLRRFLPGAVILREGEPGDSFFLLARGKVRITKQVGGERLALARLGDGAVFGEMALVSSAPRSATVEALTQVDALELTREDLGRHAGKLVGVARALLRFTRARMLSNAMALSPVFGGLTQAERHAVLERFVSLEVHKGQVILEEGRPGLGLFLVLRGDVEVKKRAGDSLVPVALLREGDVFGEISLVKEVPTTATVLAGREGELLFLSRAEFDRLTAERPALREALEALSEERLQETRARLLVTDVLADDEIVLV